MSFVDAKCPNCGGALKVDNSQETAVCPFCQSSYLVEKAINNYNITNNVNISNSVVNLQINEQNDIEGQLTRAKSLLSCRQYAEAEKIFTGILDKQPDNETAKTGTMVSIAVGACMAAEKAIFRIIPDVDMSGDISYDEDSFNEELSKSQNLLLKAMAQNREKEGFVFDYMGLRAACYEEKYLSSHKFAPYLCFRLYYRMIRNNIPDHAYVQNAWARTEYYMKYSSPALGIFGDPWNKYASLEKLRKLKLLGEDNVLYKGRDPELYRTIAKEFFVEYDYLIL